MDKKDVTVLAEAYNLLSQAELNGIKGSQLVSAGAVMQEFQRIIQELVDEETPDEVE